MSKFCAKGHQMEDSWDTCPTCQTTGYQFPPAPNRAARPRRASNLTLPKKPLPRGRSRVGELC